MIAPYLICDCCSQYVHALSPRGWCAACEYECMQVCRWVRGRFELLSQARETVTNG